MSGDVEPPAGRDLDRRRNRVSRRIVVTAVVLGLVLAAVSGLLGGQGRVGFVVLLLVTAAGCAVAALHAVATLLYDDVKERRPGRRRALVAVGLFTLAAVLMAMVAGAGG